MKSFNYTAVFISFLLLCFSASAQEIGGVKGKVRTPQGNVISQVKVTVQQNDKEIKTAVTDSKGEFLINGLKAGKYNFIFAKDGYSSGSLNNVEIGKKKVRDLGNRLVLEVDEGFLVIIKGSVFNEEGRSIYGAKVEIARVSGDGTAKKLYTSTSTESGQFTFRFPPGAATYRVTTSAKGKSSTKDITVDSAAIYRLALTLDLSKKKEGEKDSNENQ